jgi:uncharacterized protein (TIGR03437 family)
MSKYACHFCCVVGLISAAHAQPTISAVVNAATTVCSPCNSADTVYASPPWIAAGGSFTIYGSFPSATISNTTVTFTGADNYCPSQTSTFSVGPSNYAGSGQINFQVPWENAYCFFDTLPGSLVVSIAGHGTSAPFSVSTTASYSALYGCAAGSPYVQQYPGYNLVGNSCGSGNVDQSSGAPVLILYGNAFDGFQETCAPSCSDPITVTIAGTAATVLYFGTGQPYWQINEQAAGTVPSGQQTVTIKSGDLDTISFPVTFQ